MGARMSIEAKAAIVGTLIFTSPLMIIVPVSMIMRDRYPPNPMNCSYGDCYCPPRAKVNCRQQIQKLSQDKNIDKNVDESVNENANKRKRPMPFGQYQYESKIDIKH